MRRRTTQGLAVVFWIATLGTVAASGPKSSELNGTPPAAEFRAAVKALPSSPVKSPKPIETGPASWYGDQFDGRETASGEVFDMYDMTAAHPTLPLGCYVKVTNLRNGRAVVVKINDRGPIIPGRIIDLSYAAARALDFAELGIQKVRLERIFKAKTVAMVFPNSFSPGSVVPASIIRGSLIPGSIIPGSISADSHIADASRSARISQQ